VVDDRNIMGAYSIATPGLLAGLGLAHKTYGRLPWADLAQPAIALADRGITLDWYGAVSIPGGIESCSRSSTRLPRPISPTVASPFRSKKVPVTFLKLGRLSETLRQLAKDGPDAFYAGAIGRALIQDLSAMGCRSRSRISPAIRRGSSIRSRSLSRRADLRTVGADAGPTLARVLEGWSKNLPSAGAAPKAEHYRVYATGLDQPIGTASPIWASRKRSRAKPAPAISTSSTKRATSSPGRRPCCRASARS
jgi:gamma-glutamyltranspeptidase/glutathione hydrolase